MWSHTIFMITSSVMLQFYIIILYHVEVNLQDCIVQYTMEAVSSKVKSDVM